ncbi:hypothetical protein Tco_0535924 [Tanacetum coccineum]
MLRACPHHGFTELTQVDTFYNGLNDNDQDSLNAAAGGNLLSKTTREALNIIENKSKVRYSRNKSNVSRMNTTSRESSSKTDERIDKLADQISTLVEIVSKKVVTPATVKAVKEPCVTCGGAHAYYTFTTHIQPPVNPFPIPESDVLKTLPKPNIPYPSRLNDQKFREKASNQMEKIFQIFQDLRFDISFADALLLMPRFAPTIKNLLMNKEKLFELAKTPLNENCSVMLLKKLPEKLGDPDKFLIPCDFPGMEDVHALADSWRKHKSYGLFIWKKLSLPELTPTRMTLELADRSITRPKGLTEDVFFKTSDSLLEEFTDELALLDPFPPGNEDVDFEADLREIEWLLNHDPLTYFSPKITIDPNPERFTDEPALACLPPPGDDESFLKKDIQEENFQIYSNPLFEFDDNYNSSDINPLFNEILEDVMSKDSNVSNFDEPVLLNTPLFDEDKCFDPGGDIDEINAFLDDYKDSGGRRS